MFCYTQTMSRAKTTQVICHKDPQRLLEIEEEVHIYRGLRTKIEGDRLTIYLIDSEKYWRQRARQDKKKKSTKYEDYDDDYSNENK